MPFLTPPVTEHDHIQGAANAIIQLLEYGDYECPHCRTAYPIIKKIQEALGNKLQFIFRNFPLSNIHPYAKPAALAAEAAALQGKFWEMHDMIFENQDNLVMRSLVKMAGKLGLGQEQFIRAMYFEDVELKVERDFESGIKSGVNGTPSFYINGEKFNGSVDELFVLLDHA